MNKRSGKREIPLPPHKYQPPCEEMRHFERVTPGKIPKYYSKIFLLGNLSLKSFSL